VQFNIIRDSVIRDSHDRLSQSYIKRQ